MAIKINWQDLLKRFINWQEIVRVYKNGGQIRPETVPPSYTAWIYRNSSSWLISLSSDGINRITIADKNIGAVNLWDNWYAFQWGNNHQNNLETQVDMITWPVDATGYWPWNYYESEKFIYSETNNWCSPNNQNLRWDTTNTNEARRWPCGHWFHVPSVWEMWDIWTCLINLGVWWLSSWYNYLYLPRNTGRIREGWTLTYHSMWDESWIWTSSQREISGGRLYWQAMRLIYSASWTYVQSPNQWFVIRPFANTPVVPDSTRTVLYQPS